MDAPRDAHPDEGTIHAWLDGALDAAPAEALAAHLRGCPACAARVAEARGLIAGASRIVSALDEVPSTTVPAWGRGSAPPDTTVAPASAASGSSLWRRLRVTPARAAIAATILVAAGVTLTRQRMGPDYVPSARVATQASAPAAAEVPNALAKPERDTLLDSAIARRVAQENPPRAVERAADAGIVPVIPPAAVPSPAAIPDTAAGRRVAVGRTVARAQRETASALADRAVAGRTGRAAGTPVTSAAQTAPEAARTQPAPTAIPGASPSRTPSACYRVETANGSAATWGPVPLPMVVALYSPGTGAKVMGSVAAQTGTSAFWSPGSGDTISLQLRRLGNRGSLTLSGSGDVRAGTMRSAPTTMALEALVVTGAGAGAGAEEAKPERRARATPSARDSAKKADSATVQPHVDDIAAPSVPVVARRVTCSAP